MNVKEEKEKYKWSPFYVLSSIRISDLPKYPIRCCKVQGLENGSFEFLRISFYLSPRCPIKITAQEMFVFNVQKSNSIIPSATMY